MEKTMIVGIDKSFEKFYVVSGTLQEFLNYEASKKKDPANQHKVFVYVHNADMLRGLKNIQGCYYGTYEDRDDIEAIRSIIATSRLWNTIDDLIKPIDIADIFNDVSNTTGATGVISAGTIDSSITNSVTVGRYVTESEFKNHIEHLEKKIESLNYQILKLQQELKNGNQKIVQEKAIKTSISNPGDWLTPYCNHV